MTSSNVILPSLLCRLNWFIACLDINMFLALLRAHFSLSLSLAKNIFTRKNINYIVTLSYQKIENISKVNFPR